MSTVLWMLGAVLAVGAGVFALAGPVATVAAVGLVLIVEGVAADMFGGH